MSVTNEMQYKNSFDPITHKPPKFDIFGCLVIKQISIINKQPQYNLKKKKLYSFLI